MLLVVLMGYYPHRKTFNSTYRDVRFHFTNWGYHQSKVLVCDEAHSCILYGTRCLKMIWGDVSIRMLFPCRRGFTSKSLSLPWLPFFGHGLAAYSSLSEVLVKSKTVTHPVYMYGNHRSQVDVWLKITD